jgi:acetyltransferase-like isoleucine patch superfamily enzyme
MSRKLQGLALRRDGWITRLVYRWRLVASGRNAIVQKPLFWTPEHIALGDDVLIWPGCRIESVIDSSVGHTLSPLIEFGRGVSMQQNCHITAAGHLVIGDGTTVLHDVMITDIDHCYESFGIRVTDQPLRIAPTRIGRNCFICAGARILAGTELGDQCVVGANAVVRGRFSAGSVIAGNPAKIIKQYDHARSEWHRVDSDEISKPVVDR